jgi:hypothetical protein
VPEEFQDYLMLLLKDIDNAGTLEDLGLFTLKYILHEKGINSRYLPALAMRVTWVNGRNSTLDEAGRAIGVTRERVRQMEVKLKPLVIDLVVAPKLIYSIMGVLNSTNTWEEFKSSVKEKRLSSEIENWSIDSLKDLVQIFNVPKVNQEFNKLVSKVEPVSVDKSVSNTVRGFRNALGLIDIPSLSQALGKTQSQCIEVLKAMYPYVLISNNLAMANQRLGGSVTNILLKQLSIKSPLKPSVLVEGIERACDYRRTPLVGAQDDLEKLVIQIAGDPPSIENINPDLSDDFELGDIELWLQQVIGERSIGIIHRDELTELAISDGINPSSIGAYLSFSTIIRNVSPGIFALVGTEVEESVVESYRKSFLAEFVPPSFEYALLDERRMELTIIPNASLYTGGSLSIGSGLSDIVADFRFNTKCACGTFTSEADIRVAPSGYWVGFTALLMHSRSVHQGGPGIPLRIIFDFYEYSAELIMERNNNNSQLHREKY